jgi:hypothetical protein
MKRRADQEAAEEDREVEDVAEVEEEPNEGEQTTLSATTEVVEPSPANTE